MPDLVERLRAALDQAQHLAEQATPGPWKVDDETYAERIVAADNYTSVVAGGRWGGEGSVFETDQDARFIAAWNPARVLRLIASHRALVADVEIAQAVLDKALSGYYGGSGEASDEDVVAAVARCKEGQLAAARVAEFWLGSTE